MFKIRLLITLSDIKGTSAISLLEKYGGINPYIKKLRVELTKNGKLNLTDNQSKYILDNFDKEPILINRVINISKYLGQELQKQDNLSFIPERLLVEYILADTEKTFHVYGKLNRNQKESRIYWLPKTQVVDDMYFEPINIDVDFDKYNKLLAKQGKQLFEHQKEGVKFLLSRNSSILGFDMGLGKSILSIIAALECGAKKILIICPSSLKINWQREISVFSDDSVIVDGKNWNEAKFTIINFDILKNFHSIKESKKEDVEVVLNKEILDANFDLIIVDEAHYLKNNDSIRGKIVSELATKHNIPRVWLLTGTPVANRPMDFFNLLKIIKSPVADNWKYYATRYCDGKRFTRKLKNGQKRQIWVTDGASNLDELASRTKNIMLRRLKEDVMDMPEKVIVPMYYEFDKKERTEYEELWENYLEKRLSEGKKNGRLQRDLVELVLLRQFVAAKAIPYTIEMVENMISMGKKVVIFTTFNEEQEILARHFGKLCVRHNGSMTTIQKQKSVDTFQNNPKIMVFIGNLFSAGVGITLTAADTVVFNSFDWVPGINKQAVDRCHRIGQKNNVTAYFQLFLDSISIRVWETISMKENNISTIVGDNKPDIVDEIINEIIDETNG